MQVKASTWLSVDAALLGGKAGLKGSEEEPPGNMASPSIIAVSILVGGIVGPLRLEDALLSWLHFLPATCMCLG